ncbi:hypothetical protein AUEXF2481DRAFT_83044 [Aureobasidium subglaciale EXF-2481]|uniref:Uncharacterized protein n=1 Tax=Aureobasidium subglaciale (strain EXF-2481) TaxID=1043005 RepID=A0A074YBW8_AURSE|nr:uncharacterized protein AUEXF2481DRAFT_83044 [Aureobasidium subglaciale EXF-2481]KAI5200419.1 hypothetical protein E4T38_06589 [Aureobasidium subglaciale]KAI5218974.1 hypothetical protein E4T40_06708 [Aureobasidium subglaciale]KAI5222682.1 hypothetical protein E4T41_06529 [Aureobasidium subglaciale]KAI5260249.1 hypothetical protein E4T46_06241 [Aureobasidium subglaciale]KEQ91612.1 hypothetical protein AUEXF2481DRAFT_83044 [Aureobasidium subglaciale EXF-2481]
MVVPIHHRPLRGFPRYSPHVLVLYYLHNHLLSLWEAIYPSSSHNLNLKYNAGADTIQVLWYDLLLTHPRLETTFQTLLSVLPTLHSLLTHVIVTIILLLPLYILYRICLAISTSLSSLRLRLENIANEPEKRILVWEDEKKEEERNPFWKFDAIYQDCKEWVWDNIFVSEEEEEEDD